MDVSVPYVVSVNQSVEEKRIYTFLDTVGTKECRNAIFEFQKFLLEHERESLEKIKWYNKGAGLTFNYLDSSIGKAYELPFRKIKPKFILIRFRRGYIYTGYMNRPAVLKTCKIVFVH